MLATPPNPSAARLPIDAARDALPPPAPDPEALRARFAALYAAEFDWVHRTIRRLGGRDRDLDDLAHDVFVTVYRALGTYDPSRPLRPWLFGVCFRVVSDYRRRASFSREELGATGLDERPGAIAPPQEQAVARGEARLLVLAALERLPLDQRAVFIAVELDETPVPELAQALGLPLNTCYSRLRLARARFAAAVAELAPRPPEGGGR